MIHEKEGEMVDSDIFGQRKETIVEKVDGVC